MVMPDYALVLNTGSSSLKFCVYQKPDDQYRRLASHGPGGSVPQNKTRWKPGAKSMLLAGNTHCRYSVFI
jgi:acetate kinase